MWRITNNAFDLNIRWCLRGVCGDGLNCLRDKRLEQRKSARRKSEMTAFANELYTKNTMTTVLSHRINNARLQFVFTFRLKIPNECQKSSKLCTQLSSTFSEQRICHMANCCKPYFRRFRIFMKYKLCLISFCVRAPNAFSKSSYLRHIQLSRL